jgi:L-lactate dehydrogenase complex protein LldE
VERSIQLFATCLAEQFCPAVLRNTVELLERAGVAVSFPEGQTCCGQPFFNSGAWSRARTLADRWIEVFDASDAAIVSPSGSCVDMVRHHLPELYEPGSPMQQRARAVGRRTYELSQFLVDELGVRDVGARFDGRATYHASCHQLRGLGVRDQPKALLGEVAGLEVVPLDGEDVCCGFGGVFSVIYPEVSAAMVERKARSIEATGADVVVACDAGCLMNIGGCLKRYGSPVRAVHLAELLANP